MKKVIKDTVTSVNLPLHGISDDYQKPILISGTVPGNNVIIADRLKRLNDASILLANAGRFALESFPIFKVKLSVIDNASSKIAAMTAKIADRVKQQDTINWFLHMAIKTDDIRYYRIAGRLMEIYKGE